jgi:hypothetical protein
VCYCPHDDEVACDPLATCALTWSNSVRVTFLQNELKLWAKNTILKVKRSKLQICENYGVFFFDNIMELKVQSSLNIFIHFK